MLDNIKQLLIANDLVAANELLMTTLRSSEITTVLMSAVVDDHQFWTEVFHLHEFRIVADDTDMEQIIAPSYVNVFTSSFFITHFNSLDDVLRYSIHGGAHWKCVQMWKQCPVPYDTFNSTYRAWIEDMYGQRFVKQTIPSWHSVIPQTAEFYFEFHHIEVTPLRRQVITMLSDAPSVDDLVFNAMHQWLYRVNALEQQSFNQYMKMWQFVSNDPAYDTVLSHAFV